MTARLSYSIRQSTAWLIAAEIVHRYGDGQPLQLVRAQSSTGSSLVLSVSQVQRPDILGTSRVPFERADFNIDSGTLGHNRRDLPPMWRYPYAQEYVAAKDPESVVAAACDLIGLPAAPALIGPPRRQGLCYQLIASVLAAYCLRTPSFRVTMGFGETTGSSGRSPALERFGWAYRSPLAPPEMKASLSNALAASCWLFHRGSHEVDEPLAVIRTDCLAAAAAKPDTAIDLYDQYCRTGHSLPRTLQALEQVIEAASG